MFPLHQVTVAIKLKLSQWLTDIQISNRTPHSASKKCTAVVAGLLGSYYVHCFLPSVIKHLCLAICSLCFLVCEFQCCPYWNKFCHKTHRSQRFPGGNSGDSFNWFTIFLCFMKIKWFRIIFFSYLLFQFISVIFLGSIITFCNTSWFWPIVMWLFIEESKQNLILQISQLNMCFVDFSSLNNVSFGPAISISLLAR